MLYYMAFVFAGKGSPICRSPGILGTKVVEWAPRIPGARHLPPVQSLSLQLLLIVLLVVAVVWLQRNRFKWRRARSSAAVVPMSAAALAPVSGPA